MSRQEEALQEQEKESQFSFVQMEHSVLAFWEQNTVFEKSLEKTKKKPIYIFYDGPPFATGLPHHGHLVASTIKDIIPRYFTMQGRYVERRFGWDCHGLPIEQEIDKHYQMSASDYVSKHGLKSYNDECRGIVQKYTGEWKKTITRLGRWVDFKNDYKTMDLEFMESVWWVFKQAWEKGLIYQGRKVVPYSTELQTGLSNFEATSNYHTVQDPALTVLFKLKDEDCFIAAWTTTPWTLPSNLGLCVHRDIDYVKVQDEEHKRSFYIAESRLAPLQKKYQLTLLETIKGSELVGKKYEPLFPYFKEKKNEGAFVILADDYVSIEDGTGVVHLAPDFGEDDNRIFAEAGLKAVSACPIDAAGKFTSEVSDYAGVFVKDADKDIIKKLKDRNLVLDHTTIEHNYPYCPRTDTPLIYRTLPQWYLNVEKIKDDIVAANCQVNWVPEHIKEGRFGKWLENARDWAISRNRYWGTPLPIWINSTTGKAYCVGSREELEKLTQEKITDLHRENIDQLSFKLQGEEGEYQRIPEVLDCWFESGSMPYAQLHYPFENEKIFQAGFPAEFIAEGLDQTRGWFYTLMVLSSMLYQKPAFKNVIVNGLVLSSDGRKMSKRLKNYTPPDVLMEEYGADALRLFLINSGVVKGEELKFTDEGVKDMVRRVLLPWYNAFKFFDTYASLDKWKLQDHFVEGKNITDQWIVSKLQSLVHDVSEEMNAYHLYNVVPRLFSFIEDLTNWYIRLNRRRFWEEGLEKDKQEAYSALYLSIKTLSTLMAPFAPFLSEHIFRSLKKYADDQHESVHLCDFPKADESKINKTLEDAMGRMQQIILLGRQKRNQEQVKIKTPLRTLSIVHRSEVTLNEIKKLEGYIRSELNIKEVNYTTDEQKFIKLYAKPNAPLLGKRFGKQFAQIRKLITELDSNALSEFEEKCELMLSGEIFSADDLLVFREALENTHAVSNRFITIDLDCTLDEALILEGFAREVVSRIQKHRKESGLEVSDRICLSLSGSKKIEEAVKLHKDYISQETLAVSCEIVPNAKQSESTFEIGDELLNIQLHKA